jgi:uncharacterized membrane protein
LNKDIITFNNLLSIKESGEIMPKRRWTKDEIEDYRRTHGNFFYFNKEDANLLIPKALGIGRSFNWANPISWVVTLALIIIIILRAVYKS